MNSQIEVLSFLHNRDLEPSGLPWQHQNVHQLVDIFGNNKLAKFQLDCPIISRDILDFVFLPPINTPCDVISPNLHKRNKLKYLGKERRYRKKINAIFLRFEWPFK